MGEYKAMLPTRSTFSEVHETTVASHMQRYVDELGVDPVHGGPNFTGHPSAHIVNIRCRIGVGKHLILERANDKNEAGEHLWNNVAGYMMWGDDPSDLIYKTALKELDEEIGAKPGDIDRFIVSGKLLKVTTPEGLLRYAIPIDAVSYTHLTLPTICSV